MTGVLLMFDDLQVPVDLFDVPLEVICPGGPEAADVALLVLDLVVDGLDVEPEGGRQGGGVVAVRALLVLDLVVNSLC